MAKIKKYQVGGKMKNVPDSNLAKKVASKNTTTSTKPTRSTGYYELRDDYAQPGAKQREAAMVKELNKKGPVKAPSVPKKKVGGKVIKKAKSGGSFPDLNKDGKITKADILKGRGVIKKGGSIKKKAVGCAKCGKSMKKK